MRRSIMIAYEVLLAGVPLPAAVQVLGRWSWWPTTPRGVRPPLSHPVPPIAAEGAS
jgi:uncharacterized membrane protein YdfJ with MMPL/SSD domain